MTAGHWTSWVDKEQVVVGWISDDLDVEPIPALKVENDRDARIIASVLNATEARALTSEAGI